MGIPTPAIPSFTDGTVVHQADLNALAANLTNLYNYNQGAFNTQRPCCLAYQTVSQTVSSSTDTIVNFGAASPNVGGMWVSGASTQITIQIGGIYWVFGQTRCPTITGATFPANFMVANILANGATVANAVAANLVPISTSGGGSTAHAGTIISLAANATLFLDVFTNGFGTSLQTNFGSSFLGAVYLGSST